MKQKFTCLKLTMLSMMMLFAFHSMAAISTISTKKKVKYRTSFGHCPSRSAGQLVLKLIKTFEETQSLRSLKEIMIKENLASSHFLSSYKISRNPIKKMLLFDFECPRPLMKVQIYKDNGIDSYEAILVESGELFDPTYEVLLRSEKKLATQLPFLAIPVGELEEKTQKQITQIMTSVGEKFRRKVSEVILDEKGELTVILSLLGGPSSVFLGSDNWFEKTTQLMKIIQYMESKKKIPAIINLTNSKKVVVKFNSKS